MGRFLSSMRQSEEFRDARRQEFEDYVYNRSNSARSTPPVEEDVLNDARPDTSMGRFREMEYNDRMAARQAAEAETPIDTPALNPRSYVMSMREKMVSMDKQAAADFVQSQLGKGLTSFEIVQEGQKYGITPDSLIRELQKPQYAPEPVPVDIPPPTSLNDSSVGRARFMESQDAERVKQMIAERDAERDGLTDQGIPEGRSRKINDATVARFRRARAGGDVYGPTLESVTDEVPEGSSRGYFRMNKPNPSIMAQPVMAAPPAMLPRANMMRPNVTPTAGYINETLPPRVVPQVVSPLREQALAASAGHLNVPAVPVGMTDINLSLDRPAPRPSYTYPDSRNYRTIRRGRNLMGR